MTAFKSTIRSFALISFCIVLTACGSNELQVTAQFSNTQDIDEGTTVYFNEQAIGEVADSKTQGNGSSIVIELDESAAELVASNSAVVVNRLKQQAILEIHNSNDAVTEFVQDGQQIKGLDSMFQLGAWLVGDVIQLGSSSLNEYVNAFQDYLRSDKFQQDKNTVQQQVNTASLEAQQAIESIGEELDVVMQELATKEDQASQAIEQLGQELAPIVQELANSGSLLMEQLEAFTKSLEQTDQSEQQAGQTFLQSLTAMLETLNQSIEQGSGQDDDDQETENSQ